MCDSIKINKETNTTMHGENTFSCWQVSCFLSPVSIFELQVLQVQAWAGYVYFLYPTLKLYKAKIELQFY